MYHEVNEHGPALSIIECAPVCEDRGVYNYNPSGTRDFVSVGPGYSSTLLSYYPDRNPVVDERTQGCPANQRCVEIRPDYTAYTDVTTARLQTGQCGPCADVDVPPSMEEKMAGECFGRRVHHAGPFYNDACCGNKNIVAESPMACTPYYLTGLSRTGDRGACPVPSNDTNSLTCHKNMGERPAPHAVLANVMMTTAGCFPAAEGVKQGAEMALMPPVPQATRACQGVHNYYEIRDC